jgi:hypothetical protein
MRWKVKVFEFITHQWPTVSMRIDDTNLQAPGSYQCTEPGGVKGSVHCAEALIEKAEKQQPNFENGKIWRNLAQNDEILYRYFSETICEIQTY